MKTKEMSIIKLAIYDWKQVGLSGKWAFPFILLLSYLGFSYTMAPAGVLNSFSMSAYVLFLLMMSLGLIVDAIDHRMIDAALLVKCGENQERFYLAKMISVGIYAFIGTVIGMAMPCIRYALDGTGFFIRAFTAGDVLTGILIHILFGLSGGFFGLLLNHRIFSKRPLAIAVGAMIAVVSILKIPIEQVTGWTKYILWIFPPISELEVAYGTADHVAADQMIYFFGMFVYCLLEGILYVWIMKRIKVR